MSNPYQNQPSSNISTNNNYSIPMQESRPLPNVEQIAPIDLKQFKNLTPQTTQNGLVNIQTPGLFRYNTPLQKATFLSTGKSQAFFEANVDEVDMTGNSKDTFHQGLVQGSVKTLSQKGENGTSNDIHIVGDLLDSSQSGAENARNEVLVQGKAGTAIMNGENGATNRFTASSVENMVFGGAGAADKVGSRNDAFVLENTQLLLSAGYNASSSGQFYGGIQQWEDTAFKATTQISAEMLGNAYLEGQGNQNHLLVNKGVQSFNIGEKATGNKNNITAQEGIQYFALLGKDNSNQIFSFSGNKASEAILKGSNNKTVFGGNGKQTVRVGGKDNTATIATSDLTGLEFKSDHEQKIFAEQQKDTLELGGQGNKVQADLGIGDDDIWIHADDTNSNNNFEVVGGGGNDTMTLEGAKKDWVSFKNTDGSVTYTNRQFNQKVTVADIENIRYSEKLASRQNGFKASGEEQNENEAHLSPTV